MLIQIRIEGAKLMRIRIQIRILVRIKSHKKSNFYTTKILKVDTVIIGQKHIFKGTKAFLVCSISILLDPDPHPNNTDPDLGQPNP
jgi:hypothetical protein